MANRTWLAPAVYVTLQRNGNLAQIPCPVREYLTFIHHRNHERNSRLQAQLIEAIAALNERSIVPILLKGAVKIFNADGASLGSRMLSDLDICISPLEKFETKDVLMSLGYRDLGNGREFGRDQDVGAIELHDRPNARSRKYLSHDLSASSSTVEVSGALAKIPTQTARAIHLIVHDMIKDGDYWSLRMDLRHLLDLVELVNSPDGIDWEQVQQVMSDKTARNALVVQAKALEDLFGVEIPHALRAGVAASLVHVGRLFAASPGRTGSVTRLIGNISRGLNRIGDGFAGSVGGSFPQKVYRRITSVGKGPRL